MIKTWIVSSLGWGNYSREYSTWILNGTLKFLWSHCGIVLYAPMYIRCFFQVKLRVEMSSSPLYTYDPAIPNHPKFCNKHEISEKSQGYSKGNECIFKFDRWLMLSSGNSPTLICQSSRQYIFQGWFTPHIKKFANYLSNAVRPKL